MIVSFPADYSPVCTTASCRPSQQLMPSNVMRPAPPPLPHTHDMCRQRQFVCVYAVSTRFPARCSTLFVCSITVSTNPWIIEPNPGYNKNYRRPKRTKGMCRFLQGNMYYWSGCGVIRRYGLMDVNPFGKRSAAVSSVTEGRMTTSSPTFQFAGVATCGVWREGRGEPRMEGRRKRRRGKMLRRCKRCERCERCEFFPVQSGAIHYGSECDGRRCGSE